MKANSSILIGCVFLLISFSSCHCDKREEDISKEDKVTFTFTLQCSEDLLSYVVPTATYINANGTEKVEELKMEQFSKKDATGLVGNNEPMIYTWEKVISISGTTSAQRDMRVTYKVREQIPQIDTYKMYAMIHQLDGSYTKEFKNGITIDNSTSISITIGTENTSTITGDMVLNYLKTLSETSDYVVKEAK